MSEPFDYGNLSPGVRELVCALHQLGLETTDSGDGSNHAAGMGCAMPARHAVGVVPEARELRYFADDLQERFPGSYVEVTYSPGEPGRFILWPDGKPDWSGAL